MNNPVDRLGQPLSVGDWVVAPDNPNWGEYSGIKLPVLGFRDESPIGIAFISHLTCGGLAYFGHCHKVTKINQKPETTTWDKMADIWTPDGVIV